MLWTTSSLPYPGKRYSKTGDFAPQDLTVAGMIMPLAFVSWSGTEIDNAYQDNKDEDRAP
jgi:hypothetical protein